MTTTNLSDKALAVFAFAAYHQLSSGEPVSRVTRRDGAGHEADSEAVAELERGGLVGTDGDWIVLKPEAERILGELIEAMRGRVNGG